MKIYTRVEQVAPRQLALTNGNMTPPSQDMEEEGNPESIFWLHTLITISILTTHLPYPTHMYLNSLTWVDTSSSDCHWRRKKGEETHMSSSAAPPQHHLANNAIISFDQPHSLLRLHFLWYQTHYVSLSFCSLIIEPSFHSFKLRINSCCNPTQLQW